MTAPDAGPEVDQELFRQVIGHFASGVTVVTTRHDGRRFGMTASAVASLSVEPPMLLVCINRRAPTRSAVSGSRVFGVNILGEDDVHLAERFAAPRSDKFAGLTIVEGSAGIPMLATALARLECRVTEDVRGGTHSIFLGRVLRAEARAGTPLAYFRGRFGRLEQAEDEAAYAGLRERLLNGWLPVGEALDVARIARELGCEPWPVHHALAGAPCPDQARGRGPRGPGAGGRVRGASRRPRHRERRPGGPAGHRARGGREVRGPDLAARGRGAAAPDGGDAAAGAGRPLHRPRPLHGGERGLHEHMVGLAGSRILSHAYRMLTIPAIMARTLRRSAVAEDGLRDDHRELVEAYERGDRARARAVIDRHAERSKRIHRRVFETATDEEAT